MPESTVADSMHIVDRNAVEHSTIHELLSYRRGVNVGTTLSMYYKYKDNQKNNLMGLSRKLYFFMCSTTSLMMNEHKKFHLFKEIGIDIDLIVNSQSSTIEQVEMFVDLLLSRKMTIFNRLKFVNRDANRSVDGEIKHIEFRLKGLYDSFDVAGGKYAAYADELISLYSAFGSERDKDYLARFPNGHLTMSGTGLFFSHIKLKSKEKHIMSKVRAR